MLHTCMIRKFINKFRTMHTILGTSLRNTNTGPSSNKQKSNNDSIGSYEKNRDRQKKSDRCLKFVAEQQTSKKD